MPLKIIPVQAQRVRLNLDTSLDPEQDTWVEVNKATVGDINKLADLGSRIERVYNQEDNTYSVITNWNPSTIACYKAFLVLAGCDILDENDKPMFSFKKFGSRMQVSTDFQVFQSVWAKLPAEIADAIMEAVYETNPEWDPDPKPFRG